MGPSGLMLMDISDFNLTFSRVRWRIAGLGMVRMLVRYFPDKMWLKGNMDRWGKISNYICSYLPIP